MENRKRGAEEREEVVGTTGWRMYWTTAREWWTAGESWHDPHCPLPTPEWIDTGPFPAFIIIYFNQKPSSGKLYKGFASESRGDWRSQGSLSRHRAKGSIISMLMMRPDLTSAQRDQQGSRQFRQPLPCHQGVRGLVITGLKKWSCCSPITIDRETFLQINPNKTKYLKNTSGCG